MTPLAVAASARALPTAAAVSVLLPVLTAALLAAHPQIVHERWDGFNHYTVVMSDAGGRRMAERLRVEPLDKPAIKRYEPGHPMADAEGYIYAPDVDPVAQMVNLISTSRNYQAGVEMLTTAKELALATLTMGR